MFCQQLERKRLLGDTVLHLKYNRCLLSSPASCFSTSNVPGVLEWYSVLHMSMLCISDRYRMNFCRMSSRVLKDHKNCNPYRADLYPVHTPHIHQRAENL